MGNNPKEDKFIFILARQQLDDDSKEKLRDSKNNDLSWSYILNKSRRNSVSPLLYKNLTNINEYRYLLARDILERLEKDYYGNLARNIIIQDRISRVLKALNAAKIKIVLLKGAALCSSVYSDIALRQMEDADLLIRKEDLPRIDKVLNSLGYSSTYSSQAYLDKSCSHFISRIMFIPHDSMMHFFLHLHLHLVNHPLPMSYAKNIDMNRIWQKADVLELAGIQTLTLSKAHMLLHLCDHGLKHAFKRLILLCDINEFIKKYKNQLQWDEVISEARMFNLSRQLYYGLYFTKEFMDVQLPDNLLDSFRPSHFSLWERRFITCILKQKHDENSSFLVYFSMEKNLKEKMKFLFRTFFPDIKTMENIMLRIQKRRNLLAYIRHILKGLYYGFKLIPKIKIT